MFSTAAGSLGRALSAVTLSLALSVGYLTVVALPARAEATHEIYDQGLADCVAAAIPGYSGDGYTFADSDLLTITTLDCSGRDISDLTGLAGLRNATTVDLSTNQIIDTTGVENLSSIQNLNLANNQISTAPAIGLDSLTTLNLSGNHIVDLSPLQSSTGLTSVIATGQTRTWTIPVSVATALPLRVRGNVLPQTMTPSDASLTIADGAVTGTIAGTYTIAFADNQYGVDFGGTLTTLVDAGSVTINDPAFAACLDEKLGVTGNTFGSVELADLTSLDCSNRNITDLSGAAALRGATSLDFSYNAITSAGPIGANAALKTLNLSHNQIQSINAVPSMQLESLNISYNYIADISPLSVITTLNTLDATAQSLELTVEADTATNLSIKDLSGALPTFAATSGVSIDAGQVTAAAGIYSIAFSSESGAKVFSGTLALGAHADVTITDMHLAQCIAVELDKSRTTSTFSNLDLATIGALSCQNQGVVGLDGMQYLTGLYYLDLSYNQVDDVTALAGLTGLIDLHLGHNRIFDVAPLVGLTSVANLYLNDNNLSSISALSGMTNVTVLDVSNNHLQNLIGVAGKSWLYSLKASGNELTSLAPISALTRLKVLEVSDNQLTSLSVIEGYSVLAKAKMTTLAAAGNRLTALPNLTGFTSLSKVDVAGNKLTSLAPLSGTVSKLSTLNVANNQLPSLSGLEGHPLMMSLDASGNQIADVSALSGLSMMSSLIIYDNQIADLSPVSGLTSLGVINARNQHPVLAVYPTIATDLGLKSYTGETLTEGVPSAGLSLDAGKVTAADEGTYTVDFGVGHYSPDMVEFSGTLTVKATYNKFVTATPTITGTPKVDSTLTAHTGTWSPEPTFAYQWNADGAPISGATSSTFVPTGAEVGKAITVTVTGTKDTYAATPVTSVATDVVTQATFSAPDKVKLSGWYTVGETLTATGTWTPTPDSVTYTWLRDDVPIEGATAATYQLTAADAGHSIAAQIAVSKSGYVDDALTSTAHAVVEGVTFPDSQLASCIGAALGSPKPTYTNQELATLTSLDCSGMTITDLTGANALTGLTSLNLSGNAVSDFSPIASLTGLQSLNVSYTGLTSLDAFSGLTGLTSLNASHNVITDISGISGLTGLTTLDLSSNEIDSLAALSNLTALTTLSASANRISDLSPLSGLSVLATPELTGQNPIVRGEADQATTDPVQGLPGGFTTYTLPEGVTLVDGKFTAPAGVYSIPFSVATEEGGTPYFTGYVRFESHTDVSIADPAFASCLASALSLPSTTQTFSNIDLTGVYDLDCAGRGIFSIDGAQYLTLMASADFSGNRIEDLGPLSGLTALTALKVGDNDVTSVAALADLTALQNLDLSGNGVSDLSALSTVPDLRMVDVSSNQLINLNGLGGHANLLTVTASGNALTDISALATLPRLTTLDLSNNQLSDLSALSTSTATTRLKTVTISGNRIASISVLSRFTKVATLRAANNKISDLTALTNLAQLLEVDVTNNQLTSLTGLSGHAILIVVKASGNQLTDVIPLGGLSMLNDVEVYDNHIADLSPLSGVVSREGLLNARGQTVSQTLVPQVATTLKLKDASGVTPATATLPDGITVDAGAVTAASEGTYAVPFVSGDFNTNHVEFSGTLTLTAAHNTFVTATPTITGTPKVGLTLTAHPGTWTPEPSFAYQWKVEGADIIGATAATFTPTSAEEGKAITVTVTGTKDTYAAASRTSAATEVVAKGTFTAPSQIAVSGTFAVGQTVTASAGTWSPEGTISYQWLRDGAPISGATNAAYVLTPDDAGKAVSVRVSASAPGYDPGAVQSTATAVALGSMYGDKPIIVGTVAIGSTLQVGTGYWNPSPSFSLQWYRAGYPIEGANGYEYIVTATDVGKAITVAQTGTVTGYAPLTKLSDATSTVPAGSLSTSTGAAVDGTMAVGQTLTAQAGTWTPTPDSFSYQWRSDGEAIVGATSSTYALAAANEGHVITVTVTAIKAGYTSASATSSDEGAVAKGSFVTATPTITGTAAFGHTLKAAVDPWAPVANLTWKWLRDGSPIDDATGSSYVLGTDDVGAKISVTVTGRLSGYADAETTSVETDPVLAAGFAAPSSISISGDLAVGKSVSVQGASWTPTPDSISYRWLRNGAPITGATAASYVLTAADLDAVVTVEATAIKAGYTSSVVTSTAGDPVAANAFDADLPVISGVPVVDGTLTATSGGWNPAPTTLTYQWQANGVDITDATGSSLTLTTAQKGAAITVVVTGKADGYADKVVTSSQTTQVALAELVGSTSVSVSGSGVVGSTLTAEDLSWKPTPDSVVYQWLRGGTAIDGANGTSYVLTASDKGKVVTVSVTATKDGYRTVTLHSVPGDPVAAASFSAATPTVTGSAVVGQTLTGTVGDWTPVPADSKLQWLRDGKAIDGATAAVYTVTAADVGAKITFAVTGGAEGYADLTATSVATDTVVKASFTAPESVSITGDMRVGEFVSAEAGAWLPTPDSVSYRWLRDGDPIVGATTTSSYLLTAADEGHVVTVTVSVAKAGYVDGSLTSTNTTAVAAGEFSAPKPSISGTPVVGATLTASTSAWTPSPSTVSYQWLANGTPIPNATGLTYKLTADELGAAITFAVKGTKPGYAETTATSDASAVVAAATFSAPATVTVSGELVVGATLSVDHGTWTPQPDSFSYRWLRDGVEITDATSASYTLTADDYDTVVTVEVTATKAGYLPASLTSTNTDKIARGSFQVVGPWISGNALVGSTLTAHSGGWRPTPSALTYQWQADGTDITDANQATFVVTPAQKNQVITVKVIGEADGYADKTMLSAATAKVAEAQLSGSTAVTVSGEAIVGSTLTASDVSWTPAADSVVFQWLRGGVPIDGANAQTYKLTTTDKNKVVTVSVTAIKDGYRTVTLNSVAADPIAPASFTAATPTISGTPAIGQTLTAEVGDWSPEPSEITLQWKRDGKIISDATDTTYVVGLDDAGAALTVEVTGKADGFADKTVASQATATVAGGQFSAPSEAGVWGDRVVGLTLTADAGEWSPTPTLSYQWYRGSSPITDATQASYTLTAEDLDAHVTVQVTGKAKGYEPLTIASAEGTAVQPGTITTSQPVVLGQAQVGRTLTAKADGWSPMPTSLSYQWYLNGTAIDGADQATYEVGEGDVGGSLTVTISGTRSGYQDTAVLESDPVEVSAAGHFAAPEEIEVSGTYAVGQTLTASVGSWTPAPTTVSYQWLRSGKAIDGATAAEYQLRAEDAGKVVTVKVVGEKAGFTSAAVRSSAPSAIARGTFTTVLPSLSGVPQIGQKLSVNPGTWTPAASVSRFQWYRSGVAIAGATGSSYTVAAADVWKTISVVVTGTRDGYDTATSTASATPVPEGVLAGPNPSISGKAKVKKTLRVVLGTWSPAPDKFTYQWYRNGKAIKKATKSSYKLTKSDRNKRITVKVTATKAGYGTRVLVSARTGKVKR